MLEAKLRGMDPARINAKEREKSEEEEREQGTENETFYPNSGN